MSSAARAYLPDSQLVVLLATLILLGTVAGNLAVERLRSLRAGRVAAWALALAAVIGVERLCAGQPPGFRMLAIIGVLLWAMKAVVLVEARAAGLGQLRRGRWLGFVGAWPGMQPRPFAEPGNSPVGGGGKLMALGVRRLLLGLALVALARLLWLVTGSRLAATVPLLPGLSLILHFGIFNIVAGGWRYVGVRAYPLFRAPLRSTSLTEFWGRRWNLAFAEMTAIAVYRPLAASTGTRPALLTSFLCSGLLHELAISVPVRAGFGLPMFYFGLHGGLMLVERALAGRGRPLTGWAGRAWTLFWLVLPLPILFHPPFLRGVVWPIIGA